MGQMITVVALFFYCGLLLLPFALMYFSALMDSVIILHLRIVLLLFCCTVALNCSYSAIRLSSWPQVCEINSLSSECMAQFGC